MENDLILDFGEEYNVVSTITNNGRRNGKKRKQTSKQIASTKQEIIKTEHKMKEEKTQPTYFVGLSIHIR